MPGILSAEELTGRSDTPDSLAALPSSSRAEKVILSCMMQGGPEIIEKVCAKLDVDAFSTPQNRTLFIHVGGLHKANRPIDIKLLEQSISDAGDLDLVGRQFGLHEAWFFTPTFTTLDEELKIVQEKYLRRSIIVKCRELERKALDVSSNHIAEYVREHINFERLIQRCSHENDTLPPGFEIPQSFLKLEPPDLEETVLIRDRYLCRKSGMFFVGPSGVGKSTFISHFIVHMALGRNCFGMTPEHPLNQLIIQAENDAGDMFEFKDGILKSLGLNDSEIEEADGRIQWVRVNSSVGKAFIEKLDVYLTYFRAIGKPIDLAVIDPLFAYLGGSATDQAVVTEFLRTWLNPLLDKHNCAAIIIHHSPKPITPSSALQFSSNENSYKGYGCAELTNWPRAILNLIDIGSDTVFQLQASKRGLRLKWAAEDGARTKIRHLAYSKVEDQISWRLADPEEIEAATTQRQERKALDKPTGGRPEKYPKEDLSAILKTLGEFTRKEAWQEMKGIGWAWDTFCRKFNQCTHCGLIIESQLNMPGEETRFICNPSRI